MAVASREIDAGAVLTKADVRVVHWPTSVAVPGLLPEQDAVGRRAVTRIAPGEPVTSTRLVTSQWAQLGSTEQAFTVPLADNALAAFLQPGDRIDLYDPGDHRLVATAARVVISTTSTRGESDEVPTAQGHGTVLVIAVPRAESATMASALANAATLGTGLIAAASPDR